LSAASLLYRKKGQGNFYPWQRKEYLGDEKGSGCPHGEGGRKSNNPQGKEGEWIISKIRLESENFPLKGI